MGRAIDSKMFECDMEVIADFEFRDDAKQNILKLTGELDIKPPPNFWQTIESISAQYLHYKKTNVEVFPRSVAKRNLELFIKELKKTGLKHPLNHKAESALFDGLILLPAKLHFENPSNGITEAYFNNSIPNNALIEAAHIAIKNLSGQGRSPNDALYWYVYELAHYYQEITELPITHSTQYNYISATTLTNSDPTSSASRFVLCVASGADSIIKNNSVNSVMERVVRQIP